MKRRYVIGLTGGIASGKTTAAKILGELGACIVDADKIGHEVLLKGTAAYKKIIDTFGEKFCDIDGEINRKALGAYVFSHSDALERLNQIMHPEVEREARIQLDLADGIAVLDAALLFETGMDALCDSVWVVAVPQRIQCERIIQRDGLTRREAMDRIRSQMPTEEKIARANCYIDGSGSVENLKGKLRILYAGIEKEWLENKK